MSPHYSEDARELILLARQAIRNAVIENRLPCSTIPDEIESWHGVFVTLFHGGRLRGCVGQVESVEPLPQMVARMAVDAALHDPRFPPVTHEELDRLEIEISVLSPLELLGRECVRAGYHGVVVENGGRRAVLLPQVAAERKWNARRFTEEACHKAGLGPEAWKNAATKIYGFTVETITESVAKSWPAANTEAEEEQRNAIPAKPSI